MLEILAIVGLSRYLGGVARGKGHSRLWGGLGPLFWIGFEMAGGCVGGFLGYDLGVYAIAFGMAIIGGLVATGIVHMLPDRAGVDDDAVAAAVGADPDAVRQNPWAS